MVRTMRRRSLPAGLALIGALTVLAGAVMAAAPPAAPLPRSGGVPVEVSRALKLVGWLSAVDEVSPAGAHLRVATLNGTFDAAVTAATQILKVSDGKVLTVSDLAPGLPLDVQGELTDTAELRAAVITVGDLPPTLASEALTLRGRVLAAFGRTPATADRQLVVVTGTRGDAVVEVDAATTLVTSDGEPLAFADLKPGLAVMVRALGTTLAVVRAESIEVSVNGRAPQVEVPGLLRSRGTMAASVERWIVGDVLVHVPADLARANANVGIGTQVIVTARRAEDGELEAVKVRVATKTSPAQVVELRGHVEKLDATTMVLDGVAVMRSAQTVAPPNLAVGLYVKVRARLDADGLVTADRIQVLPPNKVEVQFEGTIEDLSAVQWRVSGVTIRITGETVITGDVPAVGGHAEVAGVQAGDRVVEAVRISVAGSVTPASWAAVEGRLANVAPGPAIWKVVDRGKAETEVWVTEDTVIDESLGVAREGAWVSVRGRRDADNRIVAVLVKVRQSAK